MAITLPVTNFSQEQREVWQQVVNLWTLSQSRDEGKIRSTLHPDYVGWDMNSSLPHDRDFAVRSVSANAPELAKYELKPLSVQVYEHRVGVVHYSYSATVVPKGASPMEITGKWTEVYLKEGNVWTMISVSGRPDTPQGASDGDTKPA